MEYLISDIETDAIDMPTTIHMVGVIDLFTGEYTSYHGDTVPEGLIRIEGAKVIGHNFRKYDAAQIERLTGNMIKFDQKRIIDTLELSRKFVPEFPNHKLDTWGQALGYPKLKHKDFKTYSQEMDTYCERDCLITKKVFEFLLENFTNEIEKYLS